MSRSEAIIFNAEVSKYNDYIAKLRAHLDEKVELDKDQLTDVLKGIVRAYIAVNKLKISATPLYAPSCERMYKFITRLCGEF
nr:hypothetical protein K-LCC10_0249 [Kaumoebavirus]